MSQTTGTKAVPTIGATARADAAWRPVFVQRRRRNARRCGNWSDVLTTDVGGHMFVTTGAGAASPAGAGDMNSTTGVGAAHPAAQARCTLTQAK